MTTSQIAASVDHARKDDVMHRLRLPRDPHVREGGWVLLCALALCVAISALAGVL